jgi:glycosyltransferase involved in cell wall biosynthesis
VAALREYGYDVLTVAIRRAKARELLTEYDREESGRTFAILPTTLLRPVRAHARMFLTSPRRYAGALWAALASRPPGLRAALWHLFYFVEAAILASELRRRRISHIHAHFANAASEVAMLAARMLGISWSMTLHGLADFGNPAVSRLGPKISSAAMVICVSDYGRAQAMLNSNPETWARIYVVRCGIDTQRFAPERTRPEASSPGLIRLLNVGRLAPEKGHTFLLEAISRVQHCGFDYACTIVGDGPEHAQLEASARALGIADRVTFTGAVGQDEIGEYYDAADVFVMPSLAEGLPVVLMEAMAHGVPVVASRIMGIPELVEDGVNGLLVVPGRPQALADAVFTLAKDEAMRRRMGAKAREKVCNEFNSRQSAEKLARLFHEILTPAASAADSVACHKQPVEAANA